MWKNTDGIKIGRASRIHQLYFLQTNMMNLEMT